MREIVRRQTVGRGREIGVLFDPCDVPGMRRDVLPPGCALRMPCALWGSVILSTRHHSQSCRSLPVAG